MPGPSYRQMYRKLKKVVLGLLVHVTPSDFFRRILSSEALVYKSYFFQVSRSTELFDIRFSYNHCNFSRVCLLVKMASKTVTRSIKKRLILFYVTLICNSFLLKWVKMVYNN